MSISKFQSAILIVLFSIFIQNANGQSFTFSLPSGARTSAGVFKSDGSLIRTLWNGVDYSAGSYSKTWDGKDDNGATVATGTYYVKVTSNNVKYEWEGVVGNNSTSITGTGKHRAFEGVFSMAIAGNYAYYGSRYNEGWTSQFKFNLSTPQTKTGIRETFQTSQATTHVCTDGNYVYWAGYDCITPSRSFVYATRCTDDTEVTNFPYGTSRSTTWGRTFPSVLDAIDNSTSTITGVAVQKTGNYLFVARRGANSIRVVNKTTGAYIRTITLTSPRAIACDETNNLWVIYGTNTVQKFKVNSDGTLSSLITNLTGLSDPLAIAVSKDNTIVAVCDGGTSEQIKAFNNSTGAASWTLGKAGGYTTDPNVTNDKFFFVDRHTPSSSIDRAFSTFIAFAPDGSFWVGDGGNNRIQKYNSSRTWVDRIMYLPHSYNISVDQNNPTRVFDNFLEFAVDYSKPLAPNNGSWTLVRNYAGAVPAEYAFGFTTNIFRSVTTFSNGKTYAFLKSTTTNIPILYELPLNGVLRRTNVQLAVHANFHLRPNGDLRIYTNGGVGKTALYQNRALTGFDASGNPIYAPATTLASVNVSSTDPQDYDLGTQARSTDSGVILGFNKSKNTAPGNYHLGAIAAGQTTWKWKSAKSTGSSYTGDFPSDGKFDDGNGVEYPAGDIWVRGNNIFWNYKGEFWKKSQTNFWNHVSDNGLLIGQFGTWKTNFKTEAPAQLAGNVFTGEVVKVGDNLYVYHNDESIHAGIHRWKVSGLNTISTQTIAINSSGANVTPTPPTLTADDAANTLKAAHELGTSEIVVSENGGAYVTYAGTINIGNVARAAGYWKFKIKAASGRNESSVTSSPAFTISGTSNSTSPCSGTGAITRDYWANVQGESISFVPVNTTPTSTTLLSQFEGPINIGFNYASRIRGYICPPISGKYIFWIAGDNFAELWLSSSSSPSNKVRIAYASLWTNNEEWNKYPTQKSIEITLTAGQLYYVEALQKQVVGRDNLAVGWQLPNGTLERPIPGNRLKPFQTNARLENELIAEKEAEAEITIYPNPSSKDFYVIVDSKSQGHFELDLFNLKGQSVKNIRSKELASADKVKIDGTELIDGIYIVKITTQKKTVYKKVLLRKD